MDLLPPNPIPLPIDAHLPEIVERLGRQGALVLTAPPGAGKTTRVPTALLAAEGLLRGSCLLLEPRRIAARAAASRVASEWGWTVGREVGYRIRFERREGPTTRLLVVTEGILVRMLQSDPFLEGVGAVVFDEVHERHLETDLGLAMVRRVREEARPELAVVAMSATLDPGPVAAFLGGAAVVEASGRTHPVSLRYLEVASRDPLEAQVRRAVEDALLSCAGDILVFLPGRGEISRSADALSSLAQRSIDVIPLHGGLSGPEQDAALLPGSRRRVILSTNVAESSLTVPGVSAVVDSGLARSLRHDPAVELDRLETVRIARANAEQRAGRAGREGPGLCLRLWTESDHLGRPERELPEIARVDLAGTLLQLLAWGEKDLSAFPWLEPPSEGRVALGLELLSRLGLLDPGGITSRGRRAARLPLPPRLAAVALCAAHHGHRAIGALAAALLAEPDPFHRPTRPPPVPPCFSDLETRCELLLAFADRKSILSSPYGSLRPAAARRILRARDQLLAFVSSDSSAPLDRSEALGRALLSGFPDRLARRRSGTEERALMVGGRGVRLATSSGVRQAPYFVALELDAGRRGAGAEAWVRVASGIEPSWLDGPRVTETRETIFDADSERVRSYELRLWDDLVLSRAEITAQEPEREAEALAAAALGSLDAALDLSRPEVAALRSRVRSLARWRPELGLPRLDDEELAALLPLLTRGRRSFAELREVSILPILEGLLTASQLRSLAELAPEEVELPGGRRFRLRYEEGRPPVLAIQIQELFGLSRTPTVDGGRLSILLHLLAPNRRPQQITDDLSGFWQRAYPEVRKELRGRYPKHAWPEDPLRASPPARRRRR